MDLYCYLAVLYTVFLCYLDALLAASSQSKAKPPTASLRQEHLLRHLSEYDIDYPIETNHHGRYIRHVTSTDHGRRRRRSLNIHEGPIYYNVRYQGNNYHMKLKQNDKLFGKDFTVERHLKGGRIERTKLIEHCYLVGETAVSNLSAAISDCDGLSGAIETLDDILYIEPIINETNVNRTRKGKPHLIYKQSMLSKMKNVAFDMQGDEWKNMFAGAKSERKKFTFRAAKAFIRIVNDADRPVKVFYLEVGEEKLFSNFPVNDGQGINTFTSHKWIARDSISNKQLLIDGKKVYVPKANSEHDRVTVYITIPSGIKLPEYARPAPPNSHLRVINKSGRFAKISYMDENSGKKHVFSTTGPNDVVIVSTYTAHRWFANDYDTGKPLWLNTRYKFIPVVSDKANRQTVLITVPFNLKLPRTKHPEMLKDKTKYVEAMATADASVVAHHGKDKVERYMLTLMNIVSRIFHHPSLGVKIDIVVARLAILEEDPKEIKITRSPMESLNKVCKWGHKMRKGWDKTSPTFHDQTIFITRNDFGPSGYAPVSSMCYRTRSCTLNDDDGFPSAFIIAHETGHTLGMEHDGTHNNCTRDTVKGSIMAPLVRSRFDRFYWSTCSRKELVDSLHTLWCLEDVPTISNRSITSQLPGQVYNLDDQCKLDFGELYSACKEPQEGTKCTKLYCDETSYSGWCRTRNTPPLEGTTCGKRMWCRLGHCVPMTKDGSFELPTPKPTPRPIHGGWSKWSSYGRCSMTCGKGIKIRARTCNNPMPMFDGLPCQDSHMGVSFCNIKPCLGITSSSEQSKQNQCQQKGTKNRWTFYDVYSTNLDCDFENGTCGWDQDDADNFDWTPNQGKTPSSQTGPSSDHTKGPGKDGTYLFAETSRPVDVGWRTRLISKLIAKHVSCLSFWFHSFGDDDHFGHMEVLINTTKKEKRIWGQSGNKGDKWYQKHVTILSVTPYQIVFQATRGDGYKADIAIDDVKFTEGPCKLGITAPLEENKIPMDPCQTYCMSTKTQNIYKFPVLDGVRCHDNPAILDVCVKGNCQVVGCDGKIGSPITFDNCGICDGNNDTCTMNKGAVAIQPEEDEAVVLACPVGSSNIMVEGKSGNMHYLVVETAGEIKETFINGGSNMSDPGVYHIGGTEFVYSRKNNSEKIRALGPTKEEIVIKFRNKGQHIKKKALVTYQFYKPNTQPTVYVWRSLGWTNCTKPCGGGVQKRILECRRQKDNAIVKNKYCFGVTQPKPKSKNCNIEICKINFNWKIDEWESCSVTCSEGVRKRKVQCIRTTYGEKNKLVSHQNCKGKRPTTVEKCTKRQCEAMWVAGPWGKCSKTCGRGVQSRKVNCISKNGQRTWKCTASSKLPTEGYCHMIRCVADAPILLGNLSCTFEAGFCRWRNVRKVDDTDWLTRRGTTPSRYTGPRADHTFGTKTGKYLFIEASAPQKPGNKAQLISPVIKISKICLEFYFNMYGEKMGTVNVLLRTESGDKRLWFKKGDQGGRWNLVRLQITSSVAYRILFEAIRGKGFSGDSAIDDITVYQGKCPVTKFVKHECYGDVSKLCSLAVRFKWCTARAWGEYLCCDSCSKEVKYRQRRKIPVHLG